MPCCFQDVNSEIGTSADFRKRLRRNQDESGIIMRISLLNSLYGSADPTNPLRFRKGGLL